MTAFVLDRYIARRFATMLAMMIAVVGLVIFLAEYVEVLRRFSDEAGFTAALGVKLAAMRVPLLLDGMLPFAFLFAAMLHLLGLSRKLELVVARASGVSVWGILRAPLAVALVFGLAAVTLLSPLALELKKQADNLEARLSGSAGRGDSGLWFRQASGDGQSIMHTASLQEDGLVLFGVTAFVFDAAGAFQAKVSAPRADFVQGKWTLADALVMSASAAPRRLARYDLATTLTAAELRRTLVKSRTVSIWSLPSFIATAQRTGRTTDSLRLAFHTFLNRPVFMAAMVAIAATVSLRLTRYGRVWRLILTGVAAGFLLYVMTEIVGDLGTHGILSPVLAAWLPPILALTFGATALLYLEDG